MMTNTHDTITGWKTHIQTHAGTHVRTCARTYQTDRDRQTDKRKLAITLKLCD